MLKQLRNKFVWITMGIVVGMLAVILGLIFHFTAKDMEKDAYDSLYALSQSVQIPGSRVENLQLPYFTMEITLDGRITAKGHTYYDLSDDAFLLELAQTVLGQEATEGELSRYSLLYSRVLGLGRQVIIFVDTSGQEAALRSMVEIGLLIAGISVLAFWGISSLLARWAIRPVEKAWQQQKQFVSDASHELKTPLTVIVSNAELLEDVCREPEEDRCVRSIRTAAGQMRALVEGLLELARADNGQVRRSFERVCLSDLTEASAMLFEAPLYEQGRVLQTQIQPGIFLKGSSQYLKQLVDILLDNAGKYGIPGIVSVGLARQGKSCLLTVANPGEPIPESENNRIFQRFYRMDTARNAPGSFGLGLSIAMSVVQEHGGKLWVESNPTGNCFCVQLPCE